MRFANGTDPILNKLGVRDSGNQDVFFSYARALHMV